MKLFVTVGSMLPFDRLVRAMDSWAEVHPESHVVAQIGSTPVCPAFMEWRQMMTPDQYRRQCEEADLIVSHVGMGTVLTASELGKPLVLIPRRKDLGEVTSEHQVATAKWLRGRPGIAIVDSTEELESAIAEIRQEARVPSIGGGTRDQLIEALKNFIGGSPIDSIIRVRSKN